MSLKSSKINCFLKYVYENLNLYLIWKECEMFMLSFDSDAGHPDPQLRSAECAAERNLQEFPVLCPPDAEEGAPLCHDQGTPATSLRFILCNLEIV